MQDADSALGAQELRDGEPRTDTEGSRGAKPARRRDRAGSRRRFRSPVDWMVLPTLAILAFVIAFPAVRAVQLSLTNYNLINGTAHSVGLANYRALVHDSVFREALKNTIYFTLGTVVAGGVIGLLLAFLTEGLIGKSRILKSALMTPWAVPTVVTAFLFRYMLEEEGGLVNSVLQSSGITHRTVPFLASPHLALPSVTVANVWAQIPFFFLVFSAGLKAVPQEVVEAARVDAASSFDIAARIKLPYLRSTAVVAVLIMVIASFNNFPHIYSMTGGGPGFSTTTLVIYVYHLAFSSYDVGYASAVGVVWLVILLVAAVGFVRVIRSEQQA